MDFSAEEEKLRLAVVPAVVGAQHIIVLPHVGPEAEVGGGDVGAVLQARGFDERGVHVHVHLVVENEEVLLGIVGSEKALDHLSVLVPHGRTVLENRHGILGVVIQVAGAEGIVVAVLELHQVSAEAGHVFVHHILQRGAGELGAVLDDAHVAHRVDDVGVDVPQGRVAEEVSVVVEEFGRAQHLAEAFAVLVDNLGAAGADEEDFVVLGLLLGTKRQRRRSGEQQRQ